jgi:hypothetical protein
MRSHQNLANTRKPLVSLFECALALNPRSGRRCAETPWKCCPSYVNRPEKSKSQRPTAFSSIDLNTGARSLGEELMTCSTSAPAACFASASSRSPARSSTLRCNSVLARCRSATASSSVAVICLSRLALVPAPRSVSSLSLPHQRAVLHSITSSGPETRMCGMVPPVKAAPRPRADDLW